MRADRQDDDPELDAAAEALVAETVAYSVCASSGIDPGEFSISYLAGWSERTPIATIERTAALIDRLSRRIEDAVADIDVAELDDHDDAAPQLRDADPAASEAGLERLQVIARALRPRAAADQASRGAEACTSGENGDVRCDAQDALHAGVDTVSEHG